MDVDDFRLLYPRIQGAPVSVTHASCQLNVSASPTIGGTVTGSGSAACGKTRTNLRAIPSTSADYGFEGWSGGGCSGAFCRPIVGTLGGSAETVNVTGRFAQYCTISVKVGTGVGSVSMTPSDGRVKCGVGEVSYKATAGTGYCFSSWGATLGASGQQAGCLASSTKRITPAGDFTFTANFTRQQCTVTGSASPAAGGTVSGGGTVNCGESVTLSVSQAVAQAARYRFTGWSGGGCSGTGGTCTVVTRGSEPSVPVTANFTRIQYVLTASTSPVAGGTITGGGTYNSGTTVTVTTSPTAGYRFTGWSGDCTGTGACTVAMNGNRSVTANFTRIRYTLTTTASPVGGGSVSGGGTYDSGTTATVTANPNTGYSFTGWLGACTGTGACSVLMNGNKSVTATFARIQYVLTASVSPSAGGSITGGGTYNSGTTVTVTATPNAGYQFDSWSGDCTGTGTCSVVMNGNKSVTATFTAIPPPPRQCTLTASPSPSAGGTVSGGGTYTCGTTVTVTATPNTGYRFSRWSGACTGTGTCSVLVNANKSVTATFTRRQCALTASASPSGGGTVSGGGTYTCGTRVTVTASPNAGYQFSRWSGACTGTGTCSVLLNASRSVTATFTRIQYTLSTSVSPAGGGSVSGGGAYNSGTRVTVRASANTGYQFSRWSGACSGTGACSVRMNGNKAVRAHFTVKYCRVSATVGRGGGGTVSTSPTSGAVQCGTGSVTVRARASSGYCFGAWGGGLGVTGQASCDTTSSRTITKPTTDVTVTANFRPTLTISVNRVRNARGSISPGPGTYIYAYGARVTITATSAFGAVRTWGGACSGAGLTCTVVMTQPRTVSMTFSPGAGGFGEEEEGDEAETATPTPSPTPTPTPSPTATATPSPTATATPSPSATPSPTATATPSPSATPTPSPTATATPSPTATATPSPTATATPSPTATATPSPTP